MKIYPRTAIVEAILESPGANSLAALSGSSSVTRVRSVVVVWEHAVPESSLYAIRLLQAPACALRWAVCGRFELGERAHAYKPWKISAT